jgi:phosphoglycerol transferase MdoB-like AlkP superfamily enzyme
MSKKQQPFFTIIQTADNHRPFNIPEDDTDFIQQELPLDTLRKYGFESSKEYNAFAYADYAIGAFFEAAKNEAYFNNTIFVFVGDHGVEGNAAEMYPKAFTEQRLTEEHVPLLLYAPSLLTPQLHKETVSQIDVLPTIAGLLQQPYSNRTLGRDLLDPLKKEHAAFIIYHAPGWIGVVNNDYFFRKNIRIQKEELVPIKNNLPALSAAQEDSVKKQMSILTSAMYETARWMLVNNKK